MKIIVTDDDIENGQRCRSVKCPIALAAARCFPDKVVTVGPSDLTVCKDIDSAWNDPTNIKYKLPDEARAAVARFDDNGTMKPFEFELGEPVK